MSLETVAEASIALQTIRETEREARETLSNAIREARQEHSLAEIAEVLGLTRQRVEQLSK